MENPYLRLTLPELLNDVDWRELISNPEKKDGLWYYLEALADANTSNSPRSCKEIVKNRVDQMEGYIRQLNF